LYLSANKSLAGFQQTRLWFLFPAPRYHQSFHLASDGVAVALSIVVPPGKTVKSIGLGVWMDRALDRSAKIEPRWRPDDIHQLRVAFRRARTMAEALGEVDASPAWRKIKKLSRELFHALGDVRDTQVTREWVRKLAPAQDPARKHFIEVLAQREKKQKKAAAKALENFDRKHWRKLRRKLDPKAGFFPLESVVFQRIALARLSNAYNLYEQARRRRSSVAWHQTRIGIKHFRYVVENFLPQRYAMWEKDLKRFQDLLGEIHDLGVLRSLIRRVGKKIDKAAVERWVTKIDDARKTRLAEFQGKSESANSPWLIWRDGFHVAGRALTSGPLPERRTA
jgi:CHAD domain-containing protein